MVFPSSFLQQLQRADLTQYANERGSTFSRAALRQLAGDFRHAADRVLHIADVAFRSVERASIKMQGAELNVSKLS